MFNKKEISEQAYVLKQIFRHNKERKITEKELCRELGETASKIRVYIAELRISGEMYVCHPDTRTYIYTSKSEYLDKDLAKLNATIKNKGKEKLALLRMKKGA